MHSAERTFNGQRGPGPLKPPRWSPAATAAAVPNWMPIAAWQAHPKRRTCGLRVRKEALRVHWHRIDCLPLVQSPLRVQPTGRQMGIGSSLPLFRSPVPNLKIQLASKRFESTMHASVCDTKHARTRAHTQVIHAPSHKHSHTHTVIHSSFVEAQVYWIKVFTDEWPNKL